VVAVAVRISSILEWPCRHWRSKGHHQKNDGNGALMHEIHDFAILRSRYFVFFPMASRDRLQPRNGQSIAMLANFRSRPPRAHRLALEEPGWRALGVIPYTSPSQAPKNKGQWLPRTA